MLRPPDSDTASSKRLMTLRRAKPKPQPRHAQPTAAAHVVYSRDTDVKAAGHRDRTETCEGVCDSEIGSISVIPKRKRKTAASLHWSTI
ncbi:hypothetical protein M0R45_019647 [Rubus argutus]|uniref:Uncharacterized protein n=1 Tax=Rubus argutus TaxID=59490 RepID=A0AAW1X602_RUBAR